MKKQFIILVLPIVLIVLTGWHKFYVSITQLDYIPKEQSIQIITRLFYDDLEKALQERYDNGIKVAPSYDQKKLDHYIQQYIIQKFIVNVNGSKVQLSYLGHKDENDYIVCFIEVKDVEEIRQLSVENTLLMDAFPGQKNVVHVKVGAQEKSFMLSEGREKAVLNTTE